MVHEEVPVLLCDGSWEGYFTAVFMAEAMRPRAREIFLEPPAQLSFIPPMQVQTQPDKAQRVWRAVCKQLGADAQWTCEALLCAGRADRGTVLLGYLRRGWQIGSQVEEDLGNPAVWEAMRVRRQVEFEIHRMKGLVRFAHAGNDVFYSAIEPDNDILPYLAEYFQDRLGDQRFVLHDVRRLMAAVYQPGEGKGVVITPLDKPSEDPSQGDTFFPGLWRTYFQTIAIKERTNPTLQRQHMPRRYWKHLHEMQK